MQHEQQDWMTQYFLRRVELLRWAYEKATFKAVFEVKLREAEEALERWRV
jgi:hypothetical protein